MHPTPFKPWSISFEPSVGACVHTLCSPTGFLVELMAGSARANGLLASQQVDLCQATRRSVPHSSHEPEPSCPEMEGHAETSSSQVASAARSSSSILSPP